MSDSETMPARIWVSDSDSILGLEVLQVEAPERVAEYEPGVYTEYVRADRIEQYRDARRAEANQDLR